MHHITEQVAIGVFILCDWTHGESDYIEQISHSLCSLEFKPHRELYDWFKSSVLSCQKPSLTAKTREFARLNLSYTIMSKRKLYACRRRYCFGWDIQECPLFLGSGAAAIHQKPLKSSWKLSVAKRDNIIDVSLLEFCIHEDQPATATHHGGS